MKKYKTICIYINSRGNTVRKYFCDVASSLAFCKTLDQRIQRGTCGGYTFFNIYTEERRTTDELHLQSF